MTDIHFDLEYKPGSLADCDQILCCRNQSTSMNSSKSKERLAGLWGDYRYCGLPQWTLESMLDHISKNEQVLKNLTIKMFKLSRNIPKKKN